MTHASVMRMTHTVSKRVRHSSISKRLSAHHVAGSAWAQLRVALAAGGVGNGGTCADGLGVSVGELGGLCTPLGAPTRGVKGEASCQPRLLKDALQVSAHAPVQ